MRKSTWLKILILSSVLGAANIAGLNEAWVERNNNQIATDLIFRYRG